MANRRPLVLKDGRFHEVPAGDRALSLGGFMGGAAATTAAALLGIFVAVGGDSLVVGESFHTGPEPDLQQFYIKHSIADVQLGNARGHLDLFSSFGRVARGTTTGRFLIGTTTDDGTNLLQVAGAGRFTGALTVDGNATLGDTSSDTVTFNARIASSFVPSVDDAVDLGSASLEWRNLFIDGTANIDSLVADTADINAGTIDGTAIGSVSPSSGAFTTLSASGLVSFGGTSTGERVRIEGSTTALARAVFSQTTAGLTGQIQQGATGFAVTANGAQSLFLETNGATQVTINSAGVVTLHDTTSSTSPTTGALVVTSGGVGIGGALFVGGTSITVDNTRPALGLYENDQVADERLTQLVVNGKTLGLRFYRDDLSGSTGDILTAVRGAVVAVTSVSLGNATDYPDISLLTDNLVAGNSTLAAATSFMLRSAASQQRDIRFQSGTTNIWILRVSGTESGADAGGLLEWIARTDAGTTIDVPFSIVRVAGGAINLGGSSRPTVFAGEVRILDGSSGDPSLAFASDLDTGLRRIGTNNFALVAGGTDIVSIGTTGIAVTGDVTASDAASANVILVDTGGSAANMNAWVSFRDGAAERGWVGFGLDTTEMRVTNNIGIIGIYATGLTVNPAATFNSTAAFVGAVDINAGTIDGTTIGGSVAAAATITTLTTSGDHVFSSSARAIRANTSDGSDTYELFFAGGGSVSTTRGGVVGVYGNEHPSTPGRVLLQAGTGGVLVASGTWANLGSVTTVDINGGTIDGAAIGSVSPSSGAFTTLTANGAVTFTAATASSSPSTGAVVVTGGVGVGGDVYAGSLTAESVSPTIQWRETDATVDEVRWQARVNGKTYVQRTLSDDGATARNFLSASRGTGIALSSITLGNATDNPTITLQGGAIVLGAQATATTHAVRADRTITAGSGLTGGGDLTADRAVAVATAGVTMAMLADLAGLSVIGRAANTTGVPAAITGTDGQVLRVSGATLGFGTVATAGITDNAITLAKFADIATLSVIGRSTTGTGDPEVLTAANDGEVLRRSGTTLGFGTIPTGGIADNAVTMAKLADLAEATVIGRAAGAGTGDPVALTASQIIDIVETVGLIEFADGTESAPSITNAGNTNTGGWFPAADVMAISAGGSEIARFFLSGGVRTITTYASLAVGAGGFGGNLVVEAGLTTLKRGGGATNEPLLIHQTDTSGNNEFATFWTENVSTLRGSITYNRGAGLTAYNTTSDYRLKEVYGGASESQVGHIIDGIPVHTGRMHDATMVRPMFVAHEVQRYAPWAVTGRRDAVDADGAIIPQQLDHSALVPVMWAELKAQRRRIQQLETTIEDLRRAA